MMIAPSIRETHYLPRYFDVFLHRNNFNSGSQVSIDVMTLMKDQGSDSFLHNAVLGLGAMQAVKFNSSEGITPNKAYDSAVYYYSKSVAGLRQALDKFNQGDSALHSILWTTHLLGLFEVSRFVWISPIIVIANIAKLMTDATGQGWVQHLVGGTSEALVAAGPTVCLTGQGDDHGLSALLDIITLCSTLRVRYVVSTVKNHVF